MVAKLFAKHIKLREAIEYVKKSRFIHGCLPQVPEMYANHCRIGFGIGTPSRIMDLFDSGMLKSFSFYNFYVRVPGTVALIPVGALLSSSLERVVVDCSYIDQKKRGIFDMRETQQPLMALLNRPELKCRYGCGNGKVSLLFY